MAECASCGFVFLTKAPVYERLSEELAWETTSAQERQHREVREPIKQCISRALKQFRREVLKRDKLGDLLLAYVPKGRVLDIGCAGGGFLATIPEQYIPCGIEISKNLASQASLIVTPRGGQIAHNDAYNGVLAFDPESINGVVMSSFLEHEIQPSELLKRIAHILVPGGKVIIKVPNYASYNRLVRKERWCGFRLPDHVNYFTPSSLAEMTVRAGLEIVRFGWRDHHPFSDNMWMVAGKP